MSKTPLVTLLVLACAAVPAQAIPVFARRYQTSCMTCHAMPPKLNSFGEAFRLNGYRIPEWDEALIKDAPLTLASEPWKEMFPDSVWPTDIPGMPPLALRAIADWQATADETVDARNEFSLHGVHILSGGRIGDQVGWFTNVMLHPGMNPILNQAYVMFNDPLSFAGVPDYWLNIRAGAFDPRFFLSNNMTTTVSRADPLWGSKATTDWMPMMDMGMMGSMDMMGQNTFRLNDNQIGVELNGIVGRRTFWAAGVVNGMGTGAHDHGGHGGMTMDPVGENTAKDLYAQLKVKLFGRDFLGVFGDEEPSTEAKPSGGWVDNSLLFEAFAYRGKFTARETMDMMGNLVEIHGDVAEEDFNYYGAALRDTYEDLDLSVGYVWGEHDHPFFDMAQSDTKMNTWFVKAEYMVYPWLMARAAYESMNWDEVPGWMPGEGYGGSLDVERVVFGPVFAIRANVRLTLEGIYYLDHEAADANGLDDPHSIALRLDWAF